jgi:hypothetical protein
MKQSLEEQAREMSTTGLRDALSWEETLQSHGDEIGQYNPKTAEKIEAIRRELNSRRVYG